MPYFLGKYYMQKENSLGNNKTSHIDLKLILILKCINLLLLKKEITGKNKTGGEKNYFIRAFFNVCTRCYLHYQKKKQEINRKLYIVQE